METGPTMNFASYQALSEQLLTFFYEKDEFTWEQKWLAVSEQFAEYGIIVGEA